MIAMCVVIFVILILTMFSFALYVCLTFNDIDNKIDNITYIINEFEKEIKKYKDKDKDKEDL